MRVWTIQPLEVLLLLEQRTLRRVLLLPGERVLHVRPEHVPEEFRFAYDWMRAQMQRRIPGYGNHYPWWGWQNPRPDLRQSGHLPPATRGARLELELEPAMVLLSDFDAWHVVLNRGYLALSEDEDEAWHKRFEAAVPNPRMWPPPPPWHSDILASWERIFDLKSLGASDYWNAEPRYIQATFESLRLADLRRYDRFLAR